MSDVRWVRPFDAGMRWCAVLRIADGSVQTHCRGRFAEAEPHEFHDSPDPLDRCSFCFGSVAVVTGLIELRDARPTGPDTDAPFDVSDVDDAQDGLGAVVEEFDGEAAGR